jgi:hypothetical protein
VNEHGFINRTDLIILPIYASERLNAFFLSNFTAHSCTQFSLFPCVLTSPTHLIFPDLIMPYPNHKAPRYATLSNLQQPVRSLPRSMFLRCETKFHAHTKQQVYITVLHFILILMLIRRRPRKTSVRMESSWPGLELVAPEHEADMRTT